MLTEHPFGASAPALTDTAWFAVQVKSTHEKRVASLLDQRGYEQFVPCFVDRRRWSDRIKEVEQPLFPGYVFCRFAPQARLGVLKTEGVYRIVSFGSEPAAIDEQEIAAIRHAVDSGLRLRPHPYLTAGQRVRIEGGPLQGVEGIVTDVRRRDRLVLSVNLLQRALSVDIDSAWVAPLSA
jgi:transcription antitermination factor NusG